MGTAPHTTMRETYCKISVFFAQDTPALQNSYWYQCGREIDSHFVWHPMSILSALEWVSDQSTRSKEISWFPLPQTYFAEASQQIISARVLSWKVISFYCHVLYLLCLCLIGAFICLSATRSTAIYWGVARGQRSPIAVAKAPLCSRSQ